MSSIRNPGRSRHGRAAAFALVALALTACSGDADNGDEGAAEDTVAQSPAPAQARLNEADAATVAHTANLGEVQLGQLALEKAADQSVRDFAQTMIDDHTAANTQLPATQAGDPATVPLASQLQQSTEQALTTLRAQQGAAFDRAYIDNQVTMHTEVLRHLDGTLIPAAQDSGFKTTLQSMRTAAAGHLEMAQQIQSELGGSAQPSAQ